MKCNNNKRIRNNDVFKVNVTHNSLIDDSDTDNIFGEDYENDAIFEAIQIDMDDTQVTESSRMTGQSDNTDTFHKKKLKVKRRVQNKEKDINSRLIPVEILPIVFRSAFNFDYFNKMQSESFENIYKNNQNCVISAPTGSGKTVLFELSILNLINKFHMKIENIKVLYIAPTKALCFEIQRQWNKKFLNMTVGALTSDTAYYEIESIRKSNIIIATPEKWDLLTRKWQDYHRLFELVRLVLVDEIHTLGDNRGATLEAVLTRMKRICEDIRFVCVSATVPNIEDIASWLTTNRSSSPAIAMKYDETYRQVQLDKYVKDYNFNCKNEFQRDALYNIKLIEVIDEFSQGRPVLIFCPTRASTVSTAKYLSNSTINRGYTSFDKSMTDKTLLSCMKNGIAFHNAGLVLEDRLAVEQSFLDGKIRILCATSTLAVGVNLPAYLVIVKGTRIWAMSESSEYSNLDILQMIGRAGRPQFEKNGCAVIMTEPSMRIKYENLISGSDILESKLHLALLEHVCAEISLGTVSSVESAVSWLQSTFFYVRYLKNRRAYVELNRFSSFDIDESLVQFCEYLLTILENDNLIQSVKNLFQCTPFGNAMVRHYVSYKTICNILKCKNCHQIRDVLDILVKAEEFKEVKIRQNEKKLYKEINMSPLIRYPFLTEKKQSQIIDQTERKVSLIIQYELGGLEFPNYEGANKLYHILIQDKTRIFRHCYRILRCMIDCFIEKKDGMSLQNSLFLLRSVNGACWENSAMILRQIKSIGLVSVRKLIRNSIINFQELRNLSDQSLEYYLGLKLGNGIKIRRDIELLPDFNIRYKVEKYLKTDKTVEVYFKIEISANFKSSLWHGKHLSLDIISRYNSGGLIDFRRIQLSQLQYPRTFKIRTDIKSLCDNIAFSVDCQEIAGLGEKAVFLVKNLPETCTRFLENNAVSGSILDMYISGNDDDDITDDSSSSSDESLCNILIDNALHIRANNTELTKKPIIEGGSIFKGHRLLANGNYECNHVCNKKDVCRHLCCKEGIPKEMVKDRKVDKVKISSKGSFSKSKASIIESSDKGEACFSPAISEAQKQHKIIEDNSSDLEIFENENYNFSACLDNDDFNYHGNNDDDMNHRGNNDGVKIKAVKANNRIDQISLSSSGADRDNTDKPTILAQNSSETDGDSIALSFLGSDIELC